jgi:hypothetical protein
MNEELKQAIQAAITDAAEQEDLVSIVAAAAAQAVTDLGYFKAAGTEYAIRRGTVIEEIGFNTEGQAEKWAETHLPRNAAYEIPARPVGVWQ